MSSRNVRMLKIVAGKTMKEEDTKTAWRTGHVLVTGSLL